MPKRVASVILVAVPSSERVPPLILWQVTRWRRLRSAALLVGGTVGCATKTNSSPGCFSIRRHSPAWGRAAPGCAPLAPSVPGLLVGEEWYSRSLIRRELVQVTPATIGSRLQGRAMSMKPRSESVDQVLTNEAMRRTFQEAAENNDLWRRAVEDTPAFLAERGVEVPEGFSVDFLDVERQGDVIRFTGGAGFFLDVFCPPIRTGWEFCRKVDLLCETEKAIVDGKEVTIKKNCYIVCLEHIWDPEFTLPTRPPLPPLPF